MYGGRVWKRGLARDRPGGPAWKVVLWMLWLEALKFIFLVACSGFLKQLVLEQTLAKGPFLKAIGWVWQVQGESLWEEVVPHCAGRESCWLE